MYSVGSPYVFIMFLYKCFNKNNQMGMVAHDFIPSTLESETGGSLYGKSQHCVHIKLQNSQGCYIETFWLEKIKEQLK